MRAAKGLRSQRRKKMLEEIKYLVFSWKPDETQSERGGVRGAVPHLKHNTDGKADLNAHPSQSKNGAEKSHSNTDRQNTGIYLACSTYDSANHTYALEYFCDTSRRLRYVI